jgi:F-type H+-transporting ATPase subunit gamma
MQLPDLLGKAAHTLQAFIRGHVFVSLFRACAKSLVSENASRLAAMQRAERNIGELLHALPINFQQRRQASIDDERFGNSGL